MRRTLMARRAVLALSGSAALTGLVVVSTALGGCATERPALPSDVTFARRLIERAETSTPAADRSAGAQVAAALPRPHRAPVQMDQGAARRRLLAIAPERLAELSAIATDTGRLDALLTQPIGRDDLAALAVLRSPTVRAARARAQAARSSYDQADDLADLVALHRSYLTSADTRVGPERSRAPTARIAPSPGIESLSAAVARESIAVADAQWRAAVRDVVVAAERAHADAAHLLTSRSILDEQVALEDALLPILRARVESGRMPQTGVLALESRLARLVNDAAVLLTQEHRLRASWNRLLDRPAAAAAALGVMAADVGPRPAAPTGAERPELVAARAAARRAESAVRLAETMTLPRLDVGSARFERERAVEAGPERGAVFSEPGRMIMPRSDFGVREGQLVEMRARADALAAEAIVTERHAQQLVAAAVADLDASASTVDVQSNRVVPLARSAFDSARGAYEASRVTYLDLLDAARALLDARMRLADHRRQHAHARAALIDATGVLPERSPR